VYTNNDYTILFFVCQQIPAFFKNSPAKDRFFFSVNLFSPYSFRERSASASVSPSVEGNGPYCLLSGKTRRLIRLPKSSVLFILWPCLSLFCVGKSQIGPKSAPVNSHALDFQTFTAELVF